MPRPTRLGLAWLLLLPTAARPTDLKPAVPTPTFEQHVRPILKAHCFECHGEGKKLRGGLDLRLRRLIAQGGDSGPGLLAGKRGESSLFRRIQAHEMPPGKKKLSKEDIALIGRWIDTGAHTFRPEPARLAPGLYLTEEERSFWAFQPVRRPAVPAVRQSSLVRTPIDAFLLARLEAAGLGFAPEADRVTLIRRASFDLLGLPPTPEETAAFVADDRPGAYERLIDRLLASPHYGERWGRHWLDVAGYADSEGYSAEDPVRRSAWRYRDYVIRAFNADMPFDQFITEQLAGDELVRPPYDRLPPAEVEKLVATGFLRMAPDGTGSPGVDTRSASNQTVADTLQIVSTSLLGLTMHCAQCHNHRYDPIPQVDYYRLRAVFEPALDPKSWRPPAARAVVLFSDADRKKAAEIEAEAMKIDQERLNKQKDYIARTFEKQLAKLPEELREPVRTARDTATAKRTPEQHKLLRDHPSTNVTAGSLYLYDAKAAADLKAYADRAAKVRATKPLPEFVRALTEIPGKVPPTQLFHRGDPEQPKEVVAPAGLTVLASLDLGTIPLKDSGLPTTGRRLALARQLTSGRHPLTARVLVNRVWLHQFGRGIVGTPGDFGMLGERPTHPELLDWLASEFVAGGWKLKRLHRLIMTSTAYRQASQRTPELQRLDPDNRLLGRMSVRRLDAEALRDALLAVSGKLKAKAFGPPVPVMHDDVGQVVLGVDTADAAGYKGKAVPLNGEEFRRSVYVQVRRSRPLALLDTFDWAAPTPSCEVRASSTVTPQALMLMNSKVVLELASCFAERVRREAGSDARAQAAHAWRLAFSSTPSAADLDDAMTFLAGQAETFRTQKRAPGQPEPEVQALASFCQALLSSNRFLHVD
jgi:mono/diheme cytochrome c family protein